MLLAASLVQIELHKEEMRIEHPRWSKQRQHFQGLLDRQAEPVDLAKLGIIPRLHPGLDLEQEEQLVASFVAARNLLLNVTLITQFLINIPQTSIIVSPPILESTS